MIYEIHVIKAPGINTLESRIQEWINEAPKNYDKFKLLSISHSFEPDKGYRAIVTFQKG